MPKITKKVQYNYETLLSSGGEERLYRYVLGQGVLNRANNQYPEISILNHSEAFFSLYRSTGEERHSIIGRILRKAAHKLYRELQRMNSDYPVNKRFLNIVK